MESENGTGSDAPERLITINQVVAWNIAWLRREAGLRQEDLADRLGWPQNKVSEAERSWNGKRTRQFDAQELMSLAVALDVPVTALLLPPVDDGQQVTYVFRPEGQDEDCGMEDLTAFVMPDITEETGVMASYRSRLIETVGRYLGPEWEKETARWLVKTYGRNALAEGAGHIEILVASMLTEVNRLTGFAGALKKAAEEDE